MGGSSLVDTVKKCLISTIGKRAVSSNDNNGGAPESKKLRTEETHGEWYVHSLSFIYSEKMMHLLTPLNSLK